MAQAIEVYLDISTPKASLPRGLSDRTALTLSEAIQYSSLPFKVFLVIPSGSAISPPFYTQLDNAGYGLKVYVGPRSGADAVLASQETWSVVAGPDSDGRQNYFTATLNLNTTPMNTAVTGDSLATYLEFHLNRGDGAGFAPVAQLAITILAGVKDPSGAGSIPTPAASYMTRDECLSLFVAWRNDLIAANAGRTLVLSSPDASRTRELGVENDGSPIDNPG